jgi:transcriptional regulator GlxA family with amidase domain
MVIAAIGRVAHHRVVPARQVVMVIYPGLQSLDLVGPTEVLATANRLLSQPEYQLTIAATVAGPVRTSSGLVITADTTLGNIRRPLDTLLVVGGTGTMDALADPELVSQVRRLARLSGRVTSVCSGTFLLAEAELLDGRRATTHWEWCSALARLYPDIEVDPDPIYVRDGNVYTSAGVTAGMDMALALVEDDLGRDVALAVARQLVLFLHRPANQAQMSAQLAGQLAERSGLREAQRWIADHPEADLSVAALARRVGMSERNFARCFKAETGITPGRYVERARLEGARRLLEDTDRAVFDVAAACGFGTAETMRRSFLRALGCGPTDYRRRFGVGAA